jgi:hypothetical protein
VSSGVVEDIANDEEPTAHRAFDAERVKPQ